MEVMGRVEVHFRGLVSFKKKFQENGQDTKFTVGIATIDGLVTVRASFQQFTEMPEENSAVHCVARAELKAQAGQIRGGQSFVSQQLKVTDLITWSLQKSTPEVAPRRAAV